MKETRLVILLMIGLCSCALPGAGHEAIGGTDESQIVALEGPSDDAIQARLAAVFSQIEGLHDVHVRVHAGVVRLEGTTDSVTDAQRAKRLASRVEGVVHVTSDVHAPDHLLGTTWRALHRVARSFIELVPQLVAALLVFVPFVALSLLVGRWRRPFHVLGISELTGSLVRFAIRGMLLVGGILLGLEILGITGIVGAVVGALGVLGLAAGIVFKDWVANFFPAVMLGVHPPFKAGDLVQIGDREGRVVKIDPRATVLMTPDGEEIRVPNSALFDRTLINYSHYRERRLRFVVPVALHADLHVTEELGCKELLRIDGVMREPPPFMRVSALARDFIDVEFFAWVDQDAVNFRTVESRARRAVHDTLTEAGIPRPTFEVSPTRWGDAEELDAAFVQQQVERATAASTMGIPAPDTRERRE